MNETIYLQLCFLQFICVNLQFSYFDWSISLICVGRVTRFRFGFFSIVFALMRSIFDLLLLDLTSAASSV